VSNRIALGREAMRSALQLRRSLSIAREDAVNVYDIGTAIGADIMFLDRPSLEGMFLKDPDPIVLLPSRKHRPRGRLSFSCAHELGHFQLGHGTRADEYIDGDPQSHHRTDEEFSADTFAVTLLMPRQAVLNRFAVRNYRPLEADPLVLFTIAGELDVGYSTLLKHMRYGLEIVTDSWLTEQLRTTPKALKQQISGSPESTHVLIVGTNWPAVPIDLEVGDLVAIPDDATITPHQLLSEEVPHAPWRLFSALSAGISSVNINDSMYSLRVARAGYCGSFKYRFLDDPESE